MFPCELIISGGIVGISIARLLQAICEVKSMREGSGSHSTDRSKDSVLLVEKNKYCGAETSSRSSEVLHAGLYYDIDSLKARLCIQGKTLIEQYCTKNNVPFKKLGKLIVAQRGQEQDLDRIYENATLCHERHADTIADSQKLRMLSCRQAESLEPNLRCTGSAIFSPGTGIVDTHALMETMLSEFDALGGEMVTNVEMVGGELSISKYAEDLERGYPQHRLDFRDISGEITSMEFDLIINAAGLSATRVSQSIANVDECMIPTTYFAKGNYFSLSGKPPFRHLIYPVPEPGGLGIHLTLDLAGQVRFGPDVEWIVDQSSPTVGGYNFNYNVCPDLALKFSKAIRQYYPSLAEESLQPSYSGIRPKLSPPPFSSSESNTKKLSDFQVDFLYHAGRPMDNFVCLYGIESPGITSSMAIAELVCDKIAKTSIWFTCEDVDSAKEWLNSH